MKLPVEFAILRRCGSTTAKVDHVGIQKNGAGGPGKLVAVVVKVDRKKAGRQEDKRSNLQLSENFS
jgi:hypothetical protein